MDDANRPGPCLKRLPPPSYCHHHSPIPSSTFVAVTATDITANLRNGDNCPYALMYKFVIVHRRMYAASVPPCSDSQFLVRANLMKPETFPKTKTHPLLIFHKILVEIILLDNVYVVIFCFNRVEMIDKCKLIVQQVK